MARGEYRGQTRYIRILDFKPYVDTCYHIGHRLESKYNFSSHSLGITGAKGLVHPGDEGHSDTSLLSKYMTWLEI